MKHKKLLTLILLAIMSFNVFACDSTPEEDTTASTTKITTESTTEATTEVTTETTTEAATEITTETTTEITTEATTSTIEEQITEATEESAVIEEPEEITESSTEDTPVSVSDSESQYSYILNTSTMKIHYPGCFSAKRIAPKNYATSSESLESLESQGYTTCGNCF